MVVNHCYSSEYVGGKGRLERQLDDPETLTFTAITAGSPFDKYGPVGRIRYEISYARAWIDWLKNDRTRRCSRVQHAAIRHRAFFPEVGT